MLALHVSLKETHAFVSKHVVANSAKEHSLVKLLSLEDAWEVFLESPTCRRFLTLRELVIGEADYVPAMSTLLELESLLRAGRHEQLQYRQVQCRVEELLPAWALCPRLHYLAGCAAEGLGDTEELELCRFLSQTCVEGILSTGDGSQRRPWLATYPTDASDCLAHMRLSIESQRLVESDSGLRDVVTACDGRTFWFDVDQMVAAGAEIPQTADLAR